MTSSGLATAFEDWCAHRRIHPDSLGAWEAFEACQPAAPAAPVVSEPVPKIGYVAPDPAAPPATGPRVSS